MRWIQVTCTLAAVLVASEVIAGKPGGGTPPPPTGTIYFQELATAEVVSGFPITYVLGSMDGGGGNRAVVQRTHMEVRASRQLHGGKRWFLTREIVANEQGVLGGVRQEVFAVREDGAIHVRLTGQAMMDYWGAEWAPDEDADGATISMFGRQWTGMTSSDTVVDGTVGLYTAHLSFDGSGDVVGLEANPGFAVYLGLTFAGGSVPQPDVHSYSWSPGMTRLAVSNKQRTQIRVVEVANSAVSQLGSGVDPDWSPDGMKIAFASQSGDGSAKNPYKWAIQTMNADGSGRQTLLSMKERISASMSQFVFWPRWSPDGAYLAYRYMVQQNGFSWTWYVYRMASNGSGNTNLTPEVTTGSVSGQYGLSLVNWR